MRKLLVSSLFAVALLFAGFAAPFAKADHGYGGYRGGYGGYGGGYGAPSCRSQYSGYGSVTQYQSSFVPVFPGAVYQSYSFGGSPFGYSNYPQFGGSPFGGSPFGGNPFGYGAGYGSYRSVPRVQLRIGF